MEGFACGVGCMALAFSGWRRFERWCCRALADRNTGEQRRASCPPDQRVSDKYLVGSFEFEEAKRGAQREDRGFITLKSTGQNLFWQMWTPEGITPKAGLVCIHGFTDHCDFAIAQRAKALCNMGSLAVIAFDLPGHGRSDGLFAYIPCWEAFLDCAQEAIKDHLLPKLQAIRPGMKIFGFGDSMGGGVLFGLLTREKDLFTGAVLVCPMLFVSEHLKPPWLVAMIFKHIVLHFVPLWPITPLEDITSRCWSDPDVLKFVADHEMNSRINAGSCKLRLATAYQLAFVASELARSRIPEFDTPVLIIHSSDDKVTDPNISKALFDGMKGKDKQLEMPSGLMHADLFMAGPKYYAQTEERMRMVIEWFRARS